MCHAIYHHSLPIQAGLSGTLTEKTDNCEARDSECDGHAGRPGLPGVLSWATY